MACHVRSTFSVRSLFTILVSVLLCWNHCQALLVIVMKENKLTFFEMVTLSHASLWTPSGVQVNSRDSSWSLPGVFMESMWTSHWALTPTPYILLIYSLYTPAGLLMDSIRMHTFPGLLIHSCQYPSRSPEGLHKNFTNTLPISI